MGTPKILFIVINYYNETEVGDFVTHLSKQSINDYQILIVNNGSKNLKVLEHITDSNTHASVIHSDKNHGYFGGAALAFNSWINQHSQLPDFVILCNTDIEFKSKDFFSSVINENADVIGPSIISSKNKLDQNPYYKHRIALRKLKLLRVIFSFYPFYLLYQSASIIKTFLTKQLNANTENKKQEVYTIHGSFMIFNQTFFSKRGNFNYGSFLYGEEIFIGEIARINSMKVVYDPNIQILHHEHSTTGTFKKPLHIKFMKQSIDYLINTFFN